ncbi:MAG: hypothetical protein LBG06_04290 [Deltaproteobacteria bacterium]|jgi:hypothetical protein|nr:hypothetical protein [Deltaproteobacteria bacterium]
MTADIDVVLLQDCAGRLAPALSVRKLVFFRREGGAWKVRDTRDFDFGGAQGLCQARKRLGELAGLAGGAAALVARGFPGISMDVLTRAGFALYELETCEGDVLDGVAEHLESGGGEAPAPSAPYEVGEGTGEYFLDLNEALNSRPDLTTKMILRPFLDSVRFRRLSVVYCHLPPWLPPELEGRGLGWDCADAKGGVLVNIFPGRAGA